MNTADTPYDDGQSGEDRIGIRFFKLCAINGSADEEEMDAEIPCQLDPRLSDEENYALCAELCAQRGLHIVGHDFGLRHPYLHVEITVHPAVRDLQIIEIVRAMRTRLDALHREGGGDGLDRQRHGMRVQRRANGIDLFMAFFQENEDKSADHLIATVQKVKTDMSCILDVEREI